MKIIAAMMLQIFSALASASYFQGPDIAGGEIVIFSGSCPQGYTADTAPQGLYIVGKASNGTVGNTLGSAMTGASPPDTSFTPVGTNGTVSFTPAGTNGTVSFTPAGTNGTVSFTPSGTNGTVSVATTSSSIAGALAGAFGTIGGSSPGSSFTVGAETFTGSAGTVPAEAFTGSAGTVPAEAFTGSAGTVPAQAFTGTANTTMRSTIAPGVYAIFCKKN